MTEKPKPNLFSLLLEEQQRISKEKQQVGAERRFQTVENLGSLIEFFNSEQGCLWLLARIRRQITNRSTLLKDNLKSFSCGHITGIVVYPPTDISCSIPSFDQDLRIILAGKSGKVSEVFFGERVDVYFPQITNEEGRRLSYAELKNEKYQVLAVEKAMDQAAEENPRIKADPSRYRCVISSTQGGDQECPFICFVAKHYSCEQLVDEVGVTQMERLIEGFKRAIQEE